MSITVRLFSDDELIQIEKGEDNLLATIFANKKTFSSKEHHVFCNILDNLKTYNLDFGDDIVGVYATDTKFLKYFVEKEYKVDRLVDVVETVSKTIPVNFEDWRN